MKAPSPPLDALNATTGLAFNAAFEAWLADERKIGLLRRESSISIYSDMWNAFASWCLSQAPRITLESLHTADLDAFQAARYGRKASDLSLSPRYALRLLRLIDRVLIHHADRTGRAVNAAAANWLDSNPEVRYADSATALPFTEHLSSSEARGLIAFLSLARPRQETNASASSTMAWQEVRNRVSVSLQLGAGLTPGDVRVLTLNSPVSRGGELQRLPWKLRVPSDGTSTARETPVARWAGVLLRYWLEVRAAAQIPGYHLFPSTRTGKRWSRDSQYQSSMRVLTEAGVATLEGGSFRLRHTFALRQLRRGTSSDVVAAWLGIEPQAMKRYDRVLPEMADVV